MFESPFYMKIPFGTLLNSFQASYPKLLTSSHFSEWYKILGQMPKMSESQTEVEELQAESDQKIGWRVPLPENVLG